MVNEVKKGANGHWENVNIIRSHVDMLVNGNECLLGTVNTPLI